MKKTIQMVLATCLLAQVALAATPEEGFTEAQLAAMQGPVQVGEEIRIAFESSELLSKAGEQLAWSEEVTMPNASYIAIHFERFALPAGAKVVVRSPKGAAHQRSWTYTGFGKSDKFMTEGFWAVHILGDVAVVELFSKVPVAAGAVRIDSFAHGYPNLDERFFSKAGAPQKAICGSDDSDWAQCYGGTMYDKARATARLLMNGSSACTGWLVGSEGHLMTNNHCIENSSTATNTDYEFMAEGACNTNCASWLGCPGTVVATSATFVQTDSALDYTLVKLPTNVSSTYGYLQMRTSGAVLNERIYIPQHAAAWGKQIAVNSGHSSDQSGFCEVYDLNAAPCSGGPGDIGYYCDTQGGSSGSPVLGYGDHAVISLHHCANCPNRGLDITDVIADLGNNVPADALIGGPPPPPPSCTAVGDSCTANSDCCSNKCKGKNGSKTCK
jgi:V8-like Glu-specific endopeptidase